MYLHLQINKTRKNVNFSLLRVLCDFYFHDHQVNDGLENKGITSCVRLLLAWVHVCRACLRIMRKCLRRVVIRFMISFSCSFHVCICWRVRFFCSKYFRVLYVSYLVLYTFFQDINCIARIVACWYLIASL